MTMLLNLWQNSCSNQLTSDLLVYNVAAERSLNWLGNHLNWRWPSYKVTRTYLRILMCDCSCHVDQIIKLSNLYPLPSTHPHQLFPINANIQKQCFKSWSIFVPWIISNSELGSLHVTSLTHKLPHVYMSPITDHQYLYKLLPPPFTT